MRIAIIGYGGVGRALVKLIKDKKDELLKDGINPIMKYVIGSKGGVVPAAASILRDLINIHHGFKYIK